MITSAWMVNAEILETAPEKAGISCKTLPIAAMDMTTAAVIAKAVWLIVGFVSIKQL